MSHIVEGRWHDRTVAQWQIESAEGSKFCDAVVNGSSHITTAELMEAYDQGRISLDEISILESLRRQAAGELAGQQITHRIVKVA